MAMPVPSGKPRRHSSQGLACDSRSCNRMVDVIIPRDDFARVETYCGRCGHIRGIQLLDSVVNERRKRIEAIMREPLFSVEQE